MGNEWKEVSFADVIEIISGGTPKTSVTEYWGGNIPWLSVSDFNSGFRWVSKAEKTITERGLAESATTILNRGDIIISARGTVGAIAQLAKPMAFNQSCYGVRGKKGIAETNFVYYALRHAVSQMQQVAHGGVFNTITRDTFKIITTKLPPLPEQRAIAHILGTLDDKIELNRRMNETLEEMARALFKSWFMDFDPVRAKAAVRREHPDWSNVQVNRAACPNLKPEIAELFPDEFENSELGEIPKGWKVGRLGDVVQSYDSKRIPLSNRERAKRKGQYRYYGAAGIIDYVDDFLFDGIYILVGEDGSVITDMGNPVVQYVWGKFWVNNHAHVLKASGSLSNEHLLLLLQQVYIVPFITGAVQPKLSQSNMNAVPIIVASTELNNIFSNLLDPIFSKIRILSEEIGLLAALRDTLLPKLISGELRVKDAERFLKKREL